MLLAKYRFLMYTSTVQDKLQRQIICTKFNYKIWLQNLDTCHLDMMQRFQINFNEVIQVFISIKQEILYILMLQLLDFVKIPLKFILIEPRHVILKISSDMGEIFQIKKFLYSYRCYFHYLSATLFRIFFVTSETHKGSLAQLDFENLIFCLDEKQNILCIYCSI